MLDSFGATGYICHGEASLWHFRGISLIKNFYALTGHSFFPFFNMEQANHPLRKQLIIPLLFSLFIMLAASVVSVFLIQRLHMINIIKSNANGVEQLFPTLLEMESSLLAAQIDLLKKDKDLQDAWLSHDKAALLKASFPIFLKSIPSITLPISILSISTETAFCVCTILNFPGTTSTG